MRHDEARSRQWGHPTCALPWAVEGRTLSTGQPRGKPPKASQVHLRPRGDAIPLVCRWRRGSIVWPRLSPASKYPTSKDFEMRIIALEEHFITPREEQSLPPGAHRGSDREKILGFDVVAELLNLGDKRLAAMDAAGIDLQVLSHNQPGCQALDAATAIPL